MAHCRIDKWALVIKCRLNSTLAFIFNLLNNAALVQHQSFDKVLHHRKMQRSATCLTKPLYNCLFNVGDSFWNSLRFSKFFRLMKNLDSISLVLYVGSDIIRNDEIVLPNYVFFNTLELTRTTPCSAMHKNAQRHISFLCATMNEVIWHYHSTFRMSNVHHASIP